MSRGKKRALQAAGVIVALGLAALVIYLTAFHQADVLKVGNHGDGDATSPGSRPAITSWRM